MADDGVAKGGNPWERKTVEEAVRLRLNGESRACMDHVRKIKEAGGVSTNAKDGDDTSKDQEWNVDDSCMAHFSDKYILVTSGLWLIPKGLVFVIPLLLFQVPAMSVVRIYAARLPEGTDSIARTCGFWFTFALAAFLYLPAYGLAFCILMLDYLVYWFFGLLFCAFTCRWIAVWRSMRAIDPYRNGPWVFLHFHDFFVTVVCQTCRHGLLEMTYKLTMMWCFLPWMKYYINCNPWIHNLEHRFVNQITTEMRDITPLECKVDISREIISRAKHHPGRAAKVDLWKFVPCYPYPPPGRRYAQGMQTGDSRFPVKFSLIVHTTHAHREDGGSTEHFVLSNSCEMPVWRVMLWYNNPYHFLTGWVEANACNGEKSQPDKRGGGEHPMWLISSRTPLLSERSSFTGVGFVDRFFDYWLPVFVHEMRYSFNLIKTKDHEQALKAANDKYQEVHGEDGISRPVVDKIGLSKYEGKSAYEAYGLLTHAEA